MPSEPHSPCTGLLCLFANKPLKTWPRDQLVPGDARLQVILLVWGRGAAASAQSAGTPSPQRPPAPLPRNVSLPGNPLLPPITLSGERARRINMEEEEEAGPPQPCPSSLRNKRKPLSTPRPEMGWGWRLFRCFSGWNKLVVGELGATSWLPSQPAGLPSPALAEFFHTKGQPPYPEP